MDEDHQQNTNKLEPHVLIFPLPLQGPVNCFLKLAELLCLSGIHVTFLNTDHIHRPLLRHTNVLSRFSQYPNFRFQTVPDGVDHEYPISGDRFMELVDAVDARGRYGSAVARLTNKSDAASQTHNANTPTLGDDLDQQITSVPGTEHIMRRRDLAGFCRATSLSDPVFELIAKEAQNVPRAQGLILNTFEELDGLVLPHMRKICPNIYTIGPLHSLHKTRLTPKTSPATSVSNSVWKEDRTCISWLDKHPPNTVLYISIGSLAMMTFDQMLEIWHGVVNSEKPFLWVRRPRSIIGVYEESLVPRELTEGTKEMGCIVDWAPQEEVLGHRAVGGFLTHSGWNSTIESMVEGVPMICWPYFADQQVNSRFVGEVWKVGIDIKDTCDRLIVEKAARDVMDVKRDVFTQSANIWANLAKESITVKGSSSNNLAQLIDDIKAMSATEC